MIVNDLTTHNHPIKKTIAFKGIMDSRFLKKNFEFAAENGALYSAGVSLFLSTFVRPVVIMATPKADKENKQYACARSIASSLVGFGVMGIISKPIVKAVNKIKETPKKYLVDESLNFFKNTSSKEFKFVENLVKIGTSFIYSYPKAFFTAALIPPVVSYFFNKKNAQPQKQKKLTFNANPVSEFLPRGISSIFNSKKIQKIANKYSDTNLAQHLFCANDAFITGLFVKQAIKNKKIKKNRKKTLAIHSILMTGTTIAGTYIVDNITKKHTEKFIKKFSIANKNDQKLNKYLEGIKIVKPLVIMGGLYYIVAPVIATFFAEKFSNDKFETTRQNKGFNTHLQRLSQKITPSKPKNGIWTIST